jgi:hypothetical protein
MLAGAVSGVWLWFLVRAVTQRATQSALMLYAIGLIGAQKRDVRYLWTYGFVSVCGGGRLCCACSIRRKKHVDPDHCAHVHWRPCVGWNDGHEPIS